MGKKTKLTMFDSTWSPITGCRNGCVYCYAKRIADRFAGFDDTEENRRKFAVTGYKGQSIYTIYAPMQRTTKDGEIQTAPYPFGFAPTLFSYMLNVPMTWKEPKDIFVCSMADLFADCIPDKWIQYVFDACGRAPQHRYFFLTKNPKRYIELFNNKVIPNNYDNLWFGTTVTTPDTEFFFRDDANCFLSIEPIHADFTRDFGSHDDLKSIGIKWIIVGAETGNRVGKIKPEFDWVKYIADTCELNDIPIFMKDSLKTLMGTYFVQEKPE